MDAIATFLDHLAATIDAETLSKLTLSKPSKGQEDWKNVYARPVVIKKQVQLSFTLRYTTRDETKNYDIGAAVDQIREWLHSQFRQADLFTDTLHFSLLISKKGKAILQQKKIAERKAVSRKHDQQKQRPLSERPRQYLSALGIAGPDGTILKQGRRKFRQINKYIELIEHLLLRHPLTDNARIVDMGSGKGYLTFALYDYLVNEKKIPIKMTGVELRPGLVEYCNDIARQNSFIKLEFIAGDIHQYQPDDGINMLIALHACDTATDEAIAKGIRSGAEIIVVAPCCHKQVRKAMHPGSTLNPMLQHGILLERQAEMLTDAIRSLLLEQHGYRTKVFEFIGTEHTPKNVMITAVKSKPRPEALKEIEDLKQLFGLKRHHLEDLLSA